MLKQFVIGKKIIDLSQCKDFEKDNKSKVAFILPEYELPIEIHGESRGIQIVYTVKSANGSVGAEIKKTKRRKCFKY